MKNLLSLVLLLATFSLTAQPVSQYKEKKPPVSVIQPKIAMSNTILQIGDFVTINADPSTWSKSKFDVLNCKTGILIQGMSMNEMCDIMSSQLKMGEKTIINIFGHSYQLLIGEKGTYMFDLQSWNEWGNARNYVKHWLMKEIGTNYAQEDDNKRF